MNATCTGWVTSLRDERLLYTGKAVVEGVHMERRTLRQHTRRLGGTSLPDRSREVTVLVHADLSASHVTDPRRNYSQKLVFVERTMQETGRHIHVIDDVGFGELLHGKPARCLPLRAEVEAAEVLGGF